jgi:hypothetical protein
MNDMFSAAALNASRAVFDQAHVFHDGSFASSGEKSIKGDVGKE